MRFVRVAVVWLASLVAFSGVAAAIAPAAHADSGGEEAQFLALTNQLRSSLGIQTLTPNAQLTSIARSWSAHMASQGTISHNPSLTGQAPSNWQQLGENVGMGGAVGTIQTAFINSPHHYENLAKGSYNQVGIGVVDSNGTIFVTVDFMYAPTGGGSSAPAAAPKTTSAPRAAAPATPRVTTPRPATPVTAPPTTTPAAAPAPHATTPAAKSSVAFPQILDELRSVDVTE